MMHLDKQSADNMDAWLRGVHNADHLEYRVRRLLDGTFEASCTDMHGHVVYAQTQQDALAGCVQSVRKTCFRKLRGVIAYMRDELPELDELHEDPDLYNVPRWK